VSRIVRDASSISTLTLVSRVLGLVRDVMMARVLGAGWHFGTLILAWTFPNMLRRLMGEGALSASFIPAYATALDREGKPAASKLLASVTGALLLSLSGLSAVVIVLCLVLPPTAVGQQHPDVDASETGALLLQLTAILFPYVVLICLVAIYNGALNALSVFAWPAALPAVLNVVWIGSLLAAPLLWGGDKTALVTAVAAALLAAGVVQLAIPAIQLRRHGALPRPRLPGAGDPARRVFVSMLPTALGMSMLQLNTLVDHGFAFWIISEGAVTHVYIANRLLSFPFALTTLAIATAVFPQLARLASRDRHAELEQQVGLALRFTMFLSVPASLGLILVAPDFLELFFAKGEFTAQDARLSAHTTAFLVAGLPFVGSAQLYNRALFALGDTRSPARIAILLVPVNLLLDVVLVLGFDSGVAGLTAATSICSLLQTLLLRRSFALRCGPPPIDGAALLRIVLATAAMGGAVVGLQGAFDPSRLSDLEIGVLRLVLPIAAGIVAYGGVHLLTGGAEARRLLSRLVR
jgi:putative peptidoglycan lipid II flippase